MADIINLNKARKAKSKQQRVAKAAENRVLHGLALSERKRQRLKQTRECDTHEGHLRKKPENTKTIDEQQ